MTKIESRIEITLSEADAAFTRAMNAAAEY